MLAVERLKEVLRDYPLAGLFTRLITVAHNAKAGMVCGSMDCNGYIIIKIDGKKYYGHRLAFLYMTGEWPKHLVNHKPPGMKSDNRWENIREATYTQNAYNRGPDRDNKLGVKGITQTPCGHYRVHIHHEGELVPIGTFTTLKGAITARATAAKILHGEFARMA